MKFQGMHPGRVSIYAREVWSTLDTDGDGKISKAEALNFISRRVFRADCMLMILPHCMLMTLPHCMLIALSWLATCRLHADDPPSLHADCPPSARHAPQASRPLLLLLPWENGSRARRDNGRGRR